MFKNDYNLVEGGGSKWDTIKQKILQRKLIILGVLLFVVVLIVIIVIVANSGDDEDEIKEPEGNLIQNWSFENGTKSWGSESKKCTIDTTVSRYGNNSIHCVGGGAGLYQILYNVDFGIKYKMTAHIRTKNIKNGNVLFFAESSNYIYGVYERSNNIKECKEGTCDDKWYNISVTSLMNFNKAHHYVFGFELRPKDKASGEFWVDDLSLVRVETNVLRSIIVRAWKAEVYKTAVDVLVDLEIKDSAFYDGSYLNITVFVEDEKDSKKVYQTLTQYTLVNITDNCAAKFKWDPSSLPENKFYRLRARTINSLFNNKTEEQTTVAKKLNASRTYKFYVDDNNISWLNGQKFFPIGLYFQSANEADLDYLKDSVFNVVKVPGFNKKSIDKIYNYTNKQVRVINNLNVKHSKQVNDTWLRQVRDNSIKKINEVKDAEGLIGYYVADEPGLGSIPSIREATLTIREFDPNRFAWPALLQTQYLYRWKEMFDIAGIDCYPVQHYEALQDIWVIMRRGRRSVVDSRAIWGIPQFFTWEYYTNDTTERPPTEDQLRQMTYQYIVAGAKGLIYYDFHEMKAMNHKYPFDVEWKKLKTVTDELKNTYVPIILSTTKVNPYYSIPEFNDISGANYFGYKQFRYKGYDYLLIVNVRNVAYEITFNKPNTTTSFEKMMGKGTMTITNNTVVNLKMPAADVMWFKSQDSKWTVGD